MAVLVRGFDSSGDALELVSGAVPVHVTNGGSGGTATADETAFSAGVTLGTPVMGVVNPGDTPSDGDLVVVATDSARRLKVAGTFSSSPVQAGTVGDGSQGTSPQTVGTASVQILGATGATRLGFRLQNVGTTVLYILFGAGTASSTNFHLALPAGGTTLDGSSPPYFDQLWIGAVQAAGSASGGKLNVAEFTA